MTAAALTRPIALSGASGKIGSVLRAALLAKGVRLRSAGGSRALAPLVDHEDVMHGDLRDAAFVDRLLTGVDTFIHMAGTAVERPLFPDIVENNLRALHEVYEGARRHDVRRVIFASSNHAFGMYPVTQRLTLDCEFRPDGMYGLSKVWGEAMARMHWDKHGTESVCLRIGTVNAENRPLQPRHLSTWLANADLVHLIECCLNAPKVGFMTVWGVSDNTRSYWDNTGAEQLGYRPAHNAEAYADEVLRTPDPLQPLGRRYQGGSLAARDMAVLPEAS